MKKLAQLVFLSGSAFLMSCENQTSYSDNPKIDALFEHWDKPNSPGAAVAVIKDGQVIFANGYGSANLEYDIPITPASIFHIASESKQFTAFCIVLLQQEGKLNLDDDIRKHLPYVPDFGKTITIRHLIHHTSGLRDQWQLLAIGGHSLDDVIRQENVVKLVSNQKELNFEPGARNLYCNTGYTLLAEIIKKVSGKSLREYADAKIFKPLDMKNTHFHDDNTEIVKGRTYSYDVAGSGKFVNSPLNYATVGATSLFTTVEDEAKWLENYEKGKVGGKETIEQMYEQAILNNGTKLDYAFAVVIDSVRGYKRIGHGGADAGYRSYAVRFPEEKLGVIVFSNLSEFNPQALAMQVANLHLPEKGDNKSNTEAKADNTRYKFYKGYYSFPEGQPLEIVDSTQLYIKFGRQAFLLKPLSDSAFDLFDGYAKIIFPAGASKPATQLKFKTDNEETLFSRFEKLSLDEVSRAQYVGTYESSELEAQYHILLENGKLILRHRKYPDVALEPITHDQFSTPHWWMDNLLFSRDSKGDIAGFEVNSGRVLHLKFQKKKI